MGGTYSDYLSSLGEHRSAFQHNQRREILAFKGIFDSFTALRRAVLDGKDREGKCPIDFQMFLLVMQRQAALAFDLLRAYQSFAAWAVLRPCLEAALVMGKWVDDPANAETWLRRLEDRARYLKAYQGANILSVSLPRSADIRAALTRINDDLSHVNAAYVSARAQCVATAEYEYRGVLYFDRDDELQAHLYAMLHLLMVV